MNITNVSREQLERALSRLNVDMDCNMRWYHSPLPVDGRSDKFEIAIGVKGRFKPRASQMCHLEFLRYLKQINPKAEWLDGPLP